MTKTLLCPSVFPPPARDEKTLQGWLDFLERDGQSVLLLGEIEGETVRYRGRKPPILEIELLQSLPLDASQSVRLAASCQEKRCANFDGQGCRVAASLPAFKTAKTPFPKCGIRARCRWWIQEGRAACEVCASVKTEVIKADDGF